MPNPAPLRREQTRSTGAIAPFDFGIALEKLLHVGALCDVLTRPRRLSAPGVTLGKIGVAAAICRLSHTRSVVQ